jgi:hypothetical protein
MATDFEKDIGREKIGMHIPLIKKALSNKFELPTEKINLTTISGAKIPNMDQLFYFYCKNKPYEFH